MDNNDDNLNPMPTEAPVETPTETPAPEAPIDIETTDEPAPADAPVEAPAEENTAEPETSAEETPVEETPAEPEAPAETPAEEAPAETPIEETAPIEPSVPVETPVEPTEPVIESNPVASPVIESAPIDMAAPVAPAETPKKKSKAGLIIAAIALIVILSGAIIAMLIISNTPTTPKKSGGSSSNNSNNNSSQVVEEEVELKASNEEDLKAINKLNEYFRLAFSEPGIGDDISSIDLGGYSRNGKLISGIATPHDKLENIVQYVQFTTGREQDENKKYTYATPLNSSDYKSSEDLSRYYGQFGDRETFLKEALIISEDVIADLYFKAYGEEVKHEDAIEICGGMYYDSKHKGYYYGPLNACGSALGAPFLEVKRVGSAKKGDKYYADFLASYVEYDEDRQGYEVTAEYRKPHAGIDESTELLKKMPQEKFWECEEKGFFTNCLTKEEQAKIKTYRFVFEKDGDDLHFKEVIEKK